MQKEDFMLKVTSEDFDNWYELDEFLENEFNNDIPVEISGIVGRWDGKHEIMPIVMNDIKETFNKCVDGMDYFEMIQTEPDKIELHASHHDGTDNFVLKYVEEIV